jgi:hypothetical protein
MTFQQTKLFATTMAFLLAYFAMALVASAAEDAGAAKASSPVKTGVHITPETRNSTASKVTLKLASGGRALLPIVISPQASDKTKAVAEELKKYLDQISGATFEITTGDGSSGIVLGTLEHFPHPELNDALKIYHSIDGKEALAIRTLPKQLLLLGATEKGASHAVYRFLEAMGCRWFFPSATATWDVIPQQAELSFARDITDRPAFLSRSIWYAWYFFNDPGHPLSTPENPRSCASDFGEWLAHNRMGESFVVNAGHAYEAIARENAAEFEKHPEYWALVGGKRQGPQFELSNPGLRKLIVDWAVAYFKNNPQADMVSVDPADGAGTSESEESKKMGPAGDLAFGMANEVARALQKEFPGQNKMVGMYAYNWHSDPPPFALEPNVYIQLTMAFNSGKLTLDELFEQWPKKAKNLGFYDYYSTWRWDFDMWPGGRVGNKHYLTDMIRRFQKANAVSGAYATSISAESSNNWGVNGRGYYLASKLMWNPALDVDRVLQDFYDQAFGPASAAMKKYYSYQDASPPMSPGVVGALFRTLAEARTAAQARPDVMRRLDDIANYLRYFDLNYRNAHESADGQNEARQLEVWTLAYRGRYSYMNHWEAIRQDSIHQPAHPDAPTPWKVDKPITHEETEAWFQDGLKHYPELKIPDEVKFSDDLVAVDFGGEGMDSTQLYQEGSSYLVYSPHGKPIHIKINAGGAYGGLRQTYAITDFKGKVLKEGKPKPEEKLEFDFPVPAAGIYYFNYHDGGAYGQVYWNKDQIVTLPLKDRPFRAMALVAPMYFYVPRGTREINYYYKRADWQFGGPHQIIAPDGTVAKEVAVDGDYVSVPVPQGADGKLWSIGGPTFGLGQFHFFNIPNYFSPSPAAMLLPKDVVKKDDLKPVQ